MHKGIYIIVFVLLLAGCKKSERDNDVLTNTSEENALAEAIFADAFKIINEAALKTKGISDAVVSDTSLFGCDKLVSDTTVIPKTLFVDFRFTGCEATFDIPRKGRIIAEFTGNYPDSNSIVNMFFLNYDFNNGYKVNGNITIVNRGRNEDGNRYFTFFVQDGTISLNGGITQWQANKTWEVIAGGDTKTLSDDIYAVFGTSFGYNKNGNEFDTETTIATEFLNNCLQIVRGRQQVNVKNLSKRYIDYGSGSCDRDAIVNINGEDYEVTLRQ